MLSQVNIKAQCYRRVFQIHKEASEFAEALPDQQNAYAKLDGLSPLRKKLSATRSSMYKNLIALILFIALCLVIGFFYLIAGPSLLAPLGGQDWFLSVNTASSPLPAAELLFLLLVGLLLAFGLQMLNQIARRQWNAGLLRRGVSLSLGLILWALIGYQGWLRQSAGEQQIAWIQSQLQGLPFQASPTQVQQALSGFFSQQSQLSVLALLPNQSQTRGNLRLLQDRAGKSFYEIQTQFKTGQLQSWKIQSTQVNNGPVQCRLLAEFPTRGSVPRNCQ